MIYRQPWWKTGDWELVWSVVIILASLEALILGVAALAAHGWCP